jgi:hypothetical protein
MPILAFSFRENNIIAAGPGVPAPVNGNDATIHVVHRTPIFSYCMLGYVAGGPTLFLIADVC